MVTYRTFELAPDDALLSLAGVTSEELRLIFGPKDCVNIYTGQILAVSKDQQTFQHNINSFQGCCDAIIFLLDQNQEGTGVIDGDHGKAIAVHSGGAQLSDGTVINFGFKIRREDI